MEVCDNLKLYRFSCSDWNENHEICKGKHWSVFMTEDKYSVVIETYELSGKKQKSKFETMKDILVKLNHAKDGDGSLMLITDELNALIDSIEKNEM